MSKIKQIVVAHSKIFFEAESFRKRNSRYGAFEACCNGVDVD